MSQLSLVSGAAFDIRGLDSLKREVKTSSAEGIKAAAKQMEGIFIQMMLKSMREASFKDGLMNSEQSDMFTSMYDLQISQDIAAQSKMGFADLMVRQMGGDVAPSRAIQALAPEPYKLTHGATASARAMHFRSMPLVDTGFAQEMSIPDLQPTKDNSNFVSKMLEPAIAAAKKSGIPHLLIIAQAALESGWGQKEISSPEGIKSHNIFGVKATAHWKGESTEITTTEFIGGTLRKVKAAFKVYPSYSSALDDYISLLTHNPLFEKVAHSVSPERAAQALQSGGYATDPNYAKKLINIISKVRTNIEQELNVHKTEISDIF